MKHCLTCLIYYILSLELAFLGLFYKNVRLRVYKYCQSNWNAILAKGPWSGEVLWGNADMFKSLRTLHEYPVQVLYLSIWNLRGPPLVDSDFRYGNFVARISENWNELKRTLKQKEEMGTLLSKTNRTRKKFFNNWLIIVKPGASIPNKTLRLT